MPPKAKKTFSTDWRSHKATDAAVTKFEAEFGKSMGITLERNEETTYEVIPSGLLSLDMEMTVGGYPTGRIVEIWGAEHSGKQGLSGDSVLTPTGWRQYRDLVVGDQVIGSNGTPTQILGVYPQGVVPVSKVTFSDRSSIVVGDDHLWAVQSRKQIKIGSTNRHVWSTAELATKQLRLADGSFNYRIPLVQPVQYAKHDLPIEPYTLGVLLANGHLENPIFSTNDRSVAGGVGRLNPDLMVKQYQGGGPGTGSAERYYLRSKHGCTNPVINGLRMLGLHGKTSHHKFIPETYLRATAEERLLVLQGLLDCDASSGLNKDGSVHQGNVRYYTRSTQLAHGVQEIVHSLGGTASITENDARNGHGHAEPDESKDYVVSIVLPTSISPFLFAEEKVQRHESRGHREPVRSVVSVESMGEAEGICIMVEAQDHLYVTQEHIVTHNTTLAILACVQAQKMFPDKMIGWVDMEQTFDSKWAELLGLDLKRVWRPSVKTAEDTADATMRFAQSGLCSVVVLDSIGGMIAKMEFQKEADEATVGLVAKIVTRCVKQCAPICKSNNSLLLVVNQVRADIGGYGDSLTTAGGWALKHVTTIRLNVKRGERRTVTVNGKPTQVGYQMKVKVEKNKVGPYGGLAEIWFHNRATPKYGPVGVDPVFEAAELAVRYSVLPSRPGGFYTLPDGVEIRGKDNVAPYLVEHPDLVAKIRALLLAKVSESITEEDDDDPNGLSGVDL